MKPNIIYTHPRCTVITTKQDMQRMLETCQWAGRASHMSEPDPSTTDQFLERWAVKAGHNSLLRYAHLTVEFASDRATLNQLVRHTVGGVHTQESQRYVKYGTKKNPFTFVLPIGAEACGWMVTKGENSLKAAAKAYMQAIADGYPAEYARRFLPSCTKSTMRTQFNLESWRHILKTRLANKHAQADIRALLIHVYDFMAQWPWLVADITPCMDGIGNARQFVWTKENGLPV